MLRVAVSTILLGLLVSGCLSPQGSTVGEQRQAVQQMRSETLSELYTIHPGTSSRVGKSVGHGVFSNIGVNLILMSAGSGWGVVKDSKTQNSTYMKMASGGLGFGLGVKDFRGVFVFTTESALHNFVEHGWDASAQLDVAAKSGDKGEAWAGAFDVAPGVKLYQLTKHGLALQATVQGTKYWKDADLN